MHKVSAIPLTEATLRLLEARRVLLFIHRSPDGDAVGSGFALREMLRELGKDAFVVSADPIPERLSFLLRGQADCVYRPGMEEEYDLLCAVDTASPAQLGSLAPMAEKIALSFDHHGMNEPLGCFCGGRGLVPFVGGTSATGSSGADTGCEPAAFCRYRFRYRLLSVR